MDKKDKKFKGYQGLITIAKRIKGQRFKFFLIALLIAASSLLSLLFPVLQERIYSGLYQADYQLFLTFFIYYVLLEFFVSLIGSLRNLISNKANNNIFYDLTYNSFSRFFPILSRKLDTENSGKLTNRITNDPSSMSGVYEYVLLNVGNIVRSLGYIAIIFVYSWKVSLYLVVTGTIVYLLFYYKNKIRQNYRKLNFKIRDKLTGLGNESVRGSKDIKVLDMDKQVLTKYAALVKEYNENLEKRQRKVILIDIIYYIAQGLSLLGFAAFCMFELKNGNITVPAVLVLYQNSYSINVLITNITSLIDGLNEKEIVAERILELYDEEIYPVEKYGNLHLDSVKGNMSLNNITFGYSDDVMLFNDLSINFSANKFTAIVGKSGEGKSSISNILFHLYDWQEGSVTLDDVDVRQLDKDSLKNNISLIIQQPYIFNMSIKENLLLVKSNATDEEMWQVLEKAQLKDYVEGLDKKLDSVVGENGIQMSGGQKQRLAIARALLKNTKVIIFDEATSSLDNEAQSKIQKVMDSLKGEHTIIVIAHRLSTIKNADKIVVLDNHQVSAVGTHEELMKVSQVYKKLYKEENIE